MIFCSSLDIVCEKSFPIDFYYMDDIIISGDGIDKLTANFDDKGWDVMILGLVTKKKMNFVLIFGRLPEHVAGLTNFEKSGQRGCARSEITLREVEH